MVGGSLRLPPPLKLVNHDIAEILLKVALKHKKSKIKIMTVRLKLLICTGQNIQRFQVILFSFINLYTHKGNG